jgi:cyclohexanone monooxygenase
MYALHRLRGQGLRVRVLETASDVGGTWYWNRYPGARCDVASIEYSYSFSKELQQDWDWPEVTSAQPDILRYINHVADRFDLRRDIQFETRVISAHFDNDQSRWRVTTDAGENFVTRFCIMATGCLSSPNMPPIEGAADFAGDVYHTARWPHEGVDFSGVRVGIIGTGSSGVQSIPVIAEQAKHLTVFQRTPNYVMPANVKPLTDESRKQAKAGYDELRELGRQSPYGFVLGFGGNGIVIPTDEVMQLTSEQRQAAVNEEGFAAIRRFADVATSFEANELACEMYREQVKRLVDDPETAEGLMPRGYPLGCKRPVVDVGYFETFNRDNVTHVDLRRGGIERINATSVETAQGSFEVDALVYATGFDAMTGTLLRIDIKGRDGLSLAERWESGPRTYLGLQVNGFPNFFTITGPGSPSVLTNMIMSIEQHVDWIADCITHMDTQQLSTIEASPQAEEAWIEHVNDIARGTMMTADSCNSWYLGANIPGKTRIFMPYIGGLPNYREKCDEVAANGYEGFVLA